ncbi:glycosyltransferase family 29 protein [Pseudoscourfieldia marina]
MSASRNNINAKGRVVTFLRLLMVLVLTVPLLLLLGTSYGVSISLSAPSTDANYNAQKPGNALDALRQRLRRRGTPTATETQQTNIYKQQQQRSHETEPRQLTEQQIQALLSNIQANQERNLRPNCSVVGNDSSMRSANLGPKIDSSKHVYRMNFAPLKAYAADVGSTTHTQCLNPKKLRQALKENPKLITDTGELPQRVLVVGDVAGQDVSQGVANDKPCIESSPGGLCVRRSDNERALNMDATVQRLTEELLMTMQAGVGEEEGVPTTGLYCLVLALTECNFVDVYGIGAGTIAKQNLQDLEYFKDPHFQGWDQRHNAEAERTLLRVLASRVWGTRLGALFGIVRWHNPLRTNVLINERLLERGDCTSGIHC